MKNDAHNANKTHAAGWTSLYLPPITFTSGNNTKPPHNPTPILYVKLMSTMTKGIKINPL